MKKHFLMALLLGIGCAAIALPCYRYFIAAPSRVDASDGTYREGVWVQWEKVNTAFAYEVYRALQPDSKKAQLLPNSGYAQNKVLDKDVRAGVLYYYWVKAISENEKSALSPHNSGFVAQVDDDVFALDNNKNERYKITEFMSSTQTLTNENWVVLELEVLNKIKEEEGNLFAEIYLCNSPSLDGEKTLLLKKEILKSGLNSLWLVRTPEMLDAAEQANQTSTRGFEKASKKILFDTPAGNYSIIALLSSPQIDTQYVQVLPLEVKD